MYMCMCLSEHTLYVRVADLLIHVADFVLCAADFPLQAMNWSHALFCVISEDTDYFTKPGVYRFFS